jgi:hypothetical protein
MRTVLVAEPRAGASYILDVLQAAYGTVTLVINQVETLDYYKWLLEDSRVIWLTRNNKQDQLCSWLIAHQLNKWHWTSEYKDRLIELIPRVKYSKEADDEFVKRIECVELLTQYKLSNHISTTYDQLLIDGELHPFKIKEQLGIHNATQPVYIATPYKHLRAEYIINKNITF